MNSWKMAWNSIRRSPYQSLAAFFIVFVTWFLVFLFADFINAGNTILRYFETQPQLIVFFKQDIEDEAVAEIVGNLAQQGTLTEVVKDYKVVTKTEAMESYRSEIADNPVLAELLSPDFFPASIEFSTHDPKRLGELKEILDTKVEGIEVIDYREDIVENFLKWTGVIRNTGMVLAIVFLVLTFFVINIIIGMKVVDHRQSIQIKKIIGATKFYIRKPFLIEGMLYGLISSVLAWLTIYVLLINFGASIQAQIGGDIMVFPMDNLFLLIELGMGVGLSILLSVLAAWRAVSRIIKR